MASYNMLFVLDGTFHVVLCICRHSHPPRCRPGFRGAGGQGLLPQWHVCAVHPVSGAAGPGARGPRPPPPQDQVTQEALLAAAGLTGACICFHCFQNSMFLLVPVQLLESSWTVGCWSVGLCTLQKA
jgi:hypothetical protein